MKKQKWIKKILAPVIIGTMLISSALPAYAAGNLWSSTTWRDSEGDIAIEFSDILVTLPASWEGKYQIGTASGSVSFYQTKSRALWTEELGYAGGGWLFSICCSTELDFLDLPSYETIGETENGYYYIQYPTDLQAYTKDEAAYSEFREMSEDVEWIAANLWLDEEDGFIEASLADSEEYIFPQSSTAYLSQSDFSGMSAADIQMAINEIYARHHRKFVLSDVQDYFNTKSWYEGYVEADDFDVSVMNAYEGQNINLMVECLKTASDASVSFSTDTTTNSSATVDVYGTVITTGSDFFKLQQPDGTTIQFWYDPSRLSQTDDTDALLAGISATVTYDTESYEALAITVW